MNDKRKTLRTRFEPDTRFEVEAMQLRAAEAGQLERLKDRLLAGRLAMADDEEQRAVLHQAASDAAALAWATGYPLLLLPELFEEKARAGLVRYRRQLGIRQRSLGLTLTVV
jgi:hypothetical protein